MSQSEDYLDGLLNSINKAKTDAVQIQENAENKQRKAVESRKAISPDEDFLTAAGISLSSDTKASHPNLRRAFSEDDFLRDFENELMNKDADSFIDAFENEIDLEEKMFQETGGMPDYLSVVDSLLSNINEAVNEAADDEIASDDSIILTDDDSYSVDSTEESDDAVKFIEDDDSSDFDDDLSELAALFKNDDDDSLDIDADASVDSSDDSSDDLGLDLDGESLNIMDEFAPDDMDALDASEFGDEGDLSDGDLDFDSLLSSDDEDLLDIKALLDGDSDSDQLDIDEDVEDISDSSEKSGKKGKKKKEKKAKDEKTKSPFLEKLVRIIFGPEDEEDEDDSATVTATDGPSVPTEMSDEELSILAALDGEGGSAETPAAPAEDDKKKKGKKEKKPKEPKPKKEKKPKEPKPKKEKKPKVPDNSPKIPLPIIAVFLVLSLSIIGVVLIGMNYMGIQRHMSQAEELFASGDYISAYEKLNGLKLTDEDDILMRNQSRTLADLQQCQDEYEAFINYELYDFALDSLIKGIGRYNKYKEDAVEYGISEQYDAYGDTLKQEALDTFGVTEEKAMEVFNQKNRHYYTVELRKILIELGLEENDSNT